MWCGFPRKRESTSYYPHHSIKHDYTENARLLPVEVLFKRYHIFTKECLESIFLALAAKTFHMALLAYFRQHHKGQRYSLLFYSESQVYDRDGY